MLVWDLPLRIFHWLLVLNMIALYFTGTLSGLWLDLHAQLGNLTLALLVFRLAWGFVGSTHSRFADFSPTLTRWRLYIKSPSAIIGHSPPAALSIFVLLLLTFAITVVGLFTLNDDIDFHGPLYDLVDSKTSVQFTAWHSRWFDYLLAFIALHLCAIAYYAFFKSRNLIKPMITGKIEDNTSLSLAKHRGGWFASFIAIGFAGLTYWSIDSGSLKNLLIPFFNNVTTH